MREIAATACLLLAPLSVAGADRSATGVGVDWPHYHGDPAQTHYSPLAQIDRDNVHRLDVAWSFDTGDAFPGSQMQCNPLVINGVLYALSPKLQVIALDAATGRLLWRFDSLADVPAVGLLRARGLAYWSDGREHRLFVAARHWLYVLDARSGSPIRSFGRNGRIDLREGLGRENEHLAVSLSTPGIVFNDLLIIGSAVGETLPAAPGDIRAIDVRTGAIRWTFHTIPAPGEFGSNTWPPRARQESGGANNWAGMAVDVERGIVFVPTGSATYDFYGANRHGDNLFANCLIALDAATGRRLWHFQFVHHDLWDRDLPAPPTLVTVARDGKDVDAVAQVTKSGHVFVFDRVTGEALFPIEERAVPRSDVPGEMAAETQPLPLLPKPFARQSLTADLLTTRTDEARAAVLERFRKLRSGGQFTPGSSDGTVMFPGFDGGAEWGGAAFDSATRILYVNSNEMAWVLRLVNVQEDAASTGKSIYLAECASCHGADRSGQPPQVPSLIGVGERYADTELFTLLMRGGSRMPGFAHLGWTKLLAVSEYVLHGRDRAVTSERNDSQSEVGDRYVLDGFKKLLDPDGYPGIEPPWGTLNAIDLDSGDYVWRVPLGEYPELTTDLGVTGSENYGGPVVTAGGLVFIAATVYDNKIRAFDSATGALLWQARLPAAGHATSAIYEADGRQFVVIAAGGGKNPAGVSSGVYVAFALPSIADPKTGQLR